MLFWQRNFHPTWAITPQYGCEMIQPYPLTLDAVLRRRVGLHIGYMVCIYNRLRGLGRNVIL